jgi:lysozyme family protein
MTLHPAVEPREPMRRPSLGQAVQHLFDATQRLAADRTDLLKIEAGQEVREVARSALNMLAAAVLLLAGWGLLVAAFVTWASRRAPVEAVLAGVGVAHALVGLWFARRNGDGS